MENHSNDWQKLRGSSEIRAAEEFLTDSRVEKLGYALVCWLAERSGTAPEALKLAVGRDDASAGERIQTAITRGITAADSDVLDCGVCPGPALFRRCLADADGAVLITADTARGGLMGFKLMTASGGLRPGDAEKILELAERLEVPERLVVDCDAVSDYYAALRMTAARWLEDDALKPLLGMRVVADTGSSTGRGFARFLESLGVEVEACPAPDRSPAGFDSSPAVEAMARAVLACGADMGVLLNTDGDRLCLVDDRGRLIHQNRLIALTAALLLDGCSGATIVTDSVTSSGLTAFIAEWGGIHYRFKRGYRNVIDEAVRLNAEGIDCPLAMETSGHAAFRENGFVDDGMYLATWIICRALDSKREGKNLFALLDELQEPVESVEIRLPVLEEDGPAAAGQELVETVLSHTLEDSAWQAAPDSREGVRITFNLDGGINNAWFQLRMSLYDPVMALNAQSDVPGGVKRILTQLYRVIRDTREVNLSPLRREIEGAEETEARDGR
ncbi:MAG: phosphomannomutase/phosphoglucomutase [Clostridia bacterium]|nr:phosphomannomutase/phosphoglucomutase [Clostridia bacterium]